VLFPVAPVVGEKSKKDCPVGGPAQLLLAIACMEVSELKLLIKVPLPASSCHLMGIALPKLAVPEKLGARNVPAVASGEMNPENW